MSTPHSQPETYDFTGDYLYFYEGRTSAARSDLEAATIHTLTGHADGRVLLDLACGSGRIANRLAARGGAVFGVDRSLSFLRRARREAARAGLNVHYVAQDMRTIAYEDVFDTVLSWYTSFGYFDDEGNADVLRRCRAALRRGGMLLLELNNRDELLRNYLPSVVVRRGKDILVDENQFDPHSGRTTITRTIVRDERVVRAEFSIRLYSFTELRRCLREAGFEDITVYAGDGGVFTARSARMIVTAKKT